MRITSPIPRKRSRLVVIPLIDIMFFLLAAFMMVSLQMSRTENIRVNLPPATQARHDFKPDMINIAVDRQGQIWLEKRAVSLPDLGLVLSNRFRLDTNAPVYISGDRGTAEGAIADVLAAVRGAGIQKVAFTVGGSEPRGVTAPIP